ncbi:MAG: methyltransferase domain-containing protein [Gammaproteobacteria bacterium]|nr:methyltransferase domain-containing protein [Gammaproteobacteria bacterium]
MQITEDLRRLMNEGAGLLEQGDLDGARGKFKQVYQANKDYPEAPHMLGVVELYSGDLGLAESYLAYAISLDSERADFYQNIGQVYMAKGKLAKAAEAYENVLKHEPGNAAVRELLAQVYFDNQDLNAAYRQYHELLEIDPQNRLARHNIAHALFQQPLKKYSKQAEQELLNYLGFPNTEHNYLWPSVAEVLKDRYGWSAEEQAIDLKKLVKDELLIRALPQVFFAEPVIENVLANIRKELLLSKPAKKQLPGYTALSAALVQQCFSNEYVYAYTEEEIQAVENLEKEITESVSTSGPLSPETAWAVVRIAMYKPLFRLGFAEQLAATDAADFPESMQALVKQSLLDIREEIQLAESMPAFAAIAEDMSQRVQSMYEENPYPRWLSLGYVEPMPLADVLYGLLPHYPAPDYADGRSLDVLIAGCGTGRHAIRSALAYTGAKVLAVDISRRSLAYAKRLADELGVTNIEFLQMDILDLPKLDRKFHLVETIGTLETLESPDAGWAAIRDVMLPNGLLHVGSYSEIARQPVVHARERIAELGLQGRPEDMRNFRRMVMDGDLGADGDALMRVGDFYSLSGIRDFLFHVSEKRFYIQQIVDILNEHNLRFIGFSQIKPALAALYRENFPTEKSMTDLENWISLEEKQAEEIQNAMNLSMYYYWCQLV